MIKKKNEGKKDGNMVDSKLRVYNWDKLQFDFTMAWFYVWLFHALYVYDTLVVFVLIIDKNVCGINVFEFFLTVKL